MKVTVCMGSQCVAMGSMNIMAQMEELKHQDGIKNLELESVRCMGVCGGDADACPVVMVDDRIIKSAESQDIMALVMDKAE